MNIFKKIQKWWLFSINNPVLRTGEAGGFKWSFRRFWLDISTLSGNFKARFIAGEHPYGYLCAGQDDQTQGFAERMYMIGSLLTTDQKFVNDIDKAIKNYEKRIRLEDNGEEESEAVAMEEVKQIQKYVEASPREQKKIRKASDKKLKKAVKDLNKMQ